MKPVSLCLIQMGNKGMEIIESYPKVLPKEVLDQITYKALPLGAQPGEFSTSSIGDLYYSSFAFSIPRSGERDNIGAIIGVFNDMKYNINGLKKVFSFIIKELDNKSLLKTEVIEEILPNLYKGMHMGQIRIKVSSIATISIDFETKEDEKDIDETSHIEEDIWR